MRIFMTTRGTPSKDNPLLGIFELDQAKALKAIGHEVILLSMDFRSIRRRRALGRNSYEIDGIKVEELSLPIGKAPKKLLISIGIRAAKLLIKAANKKFGAADIIHAHFAINICIMSKVVKGDIPYVVTEHSSEINTELTESEISMYKDAYRKADAVISVSKALQERVKRVFGIDGYCIHNIVDTDSFSCSDFVNKDEKERVYTFITVAGLTVNKRINLVIEAVEKMKKKGVDVKLIVVGDGPEKNSLMTLAAKLDIKDKVEFKGKLTRNQIGSIMRTADCFVLPSRSETFGVSYIEAMSAGLPVIATKCGGPEDFVNEENGLLIPVDNIDSLVHAMEAMKYNINIYDKKSISRFAKEHFSAEYIARQIESIYIELIEQRKG